MTQEETNLITYWLLSENGIPVSVINNLLDAMDTRINTNTNMEFSLWYGMAVAIDHNNTRYVSVVKDPWCWTRPTLDNILLKLATKKIIPQKSISMYQTNRLIVRIDLC